MNILNDKIKELAAGISAKIDHIKTEEATKTAFVMPFISALGYDIFSPLEVIPEFTADVATKKGEKVDYAIKKDDAIVALIECKQCGTDLLSAHKEQLYRYFSVTDAKFAILTNGISYQFFSDIDAINKMDDEPFFEFDITNYNESHLEELAKFTKAAFDFDQIMNTASDLKYTNTVKQEFFSEVREPSEEFVRFFMSRVNAGRQSHGRIDQFTNIVKRAVTESISELVRNRLQSALQVEKKSLTKETAKADDQLIGDNVRDAVVEQMEVDGYNIVKAIARCAVNASRVSMSSGKTYCSVLLDNNRRKTICRMHFNAKRKLFIELFKDKFLQRYDVVTLDDIFNYAELIQETVKYYLKGNEIVHSETDEVV